MAFTAISDIIDPEVLADQIAAKFPDHLVLANSSAVEVDETFPLGTPGTTHTIPFWKRIAPFAPLTEGVAMTPGRIQAAVEKMVVERGGVSLEVYDTAALVSKADPMSEIVRQISEQAARYVDASLVLKADKTPNVRNITGTGAGTLTVDGISSAMVLTMGDNYTEMVAGGAIIMHSKPYGDLLALGVIQNQYQSGMNVIQSGLIPTLLGLPIILSDRVTSASVSAVLQYNTYIVGPKSLGLFHQRGLKVEFDRDILLSADVVAATIHFAAHLFGWDDPTDSQVAQDARSIKVVKIISK